MRSTAAFLVASLLLAGCASTVDDADTPVEEPLQGAIFAVNGGLQATGSGAVHVDGSIHIDFLDLLAEDTEQIILIQALADGNITGSMNHTLDSPATNVLDERPDTDERCRISGWRENVPGDGLIAQIEGGPAPVWERGNGRGGMGSGVGLLSGGGQSHGSTAVDADLEEGQWLMLFVGVSGIPYSHLSYQDNFWTATLEPTMDVRIVIMPKVPLLCGAGFTRWEPPGTVLTAIGSSIASEGHLGTTLSLFAVPGEAGGVMDAYLGDTREAVEPGDRWDWSTPENKPMGFDATGYEGFFHWVLRSVHDGSPQE